MLTTIVKFIAIAASAVGLLVGSSVGHQSLFLLAVCIGAIVVLVQAVRAGKYLWVGVFAAVAVLFNPLLPAAPTSSSVLFLVLDAMTVILFLVSLQVLKNRPRLSTASITDRTPGSESL
jgi:uncharacterized protein DUF6804